MPIIDNLLMRFCCLWGSRLKRFYVTRSFAEETQSFTERKINTMKKLNDITQIIIGSAIEVHRNLGLGLLESAYQACLGHELQKEGLFVQREVPVPILYKEIKLEQGYRIDLLVEKKIIVELKVVEALNEVHHAQVLTQMKFAKMPIGLLINFNVSLLKDGLRRFAMREFM